MRALWVAFLLVFCGTPGVFADGYETQTVIAAQEALTRLGYDVGAPDGKWGAKSRKAVNELRAANGLPPADDLSGSTLALIHRLSPGATTLPNPGVIVTDPVQRQAYLTNKDNLTTARRKWCPAKVDEVMDIRDLIKEKPVAVVTTTAGPKGYISRGDDWSTPVMQTLIGAHGQCLADQTRCNQIVELVAKWAEADALEPGAKRSNKRWDDTSWIANSLLRNFVFAYADARKLTTVDPVEDAKILDWMKRRIDQYHYNIPSGNEGEVSYTEAGNHALANMMSAMVFGSLVGDRSMMEDAFASWRVAMGYMRDDGSLPTETRRGARSLQYTNFQIAQLISTAEVAKAQGIDLYAEMSADKSIPKAVGFLLDAYEDFDKVRGYAKYNEGSPGDYHIPYIIQMHFGWLPTYFARFGEDANIARMRTLAIDADICSPEALEENKLSQGKKICAGNKGEPVPLVKFLDMGGGSVGEAPNYFMGYPSQCLQGTTPSWPVGR